MEVDKVLAKYTEELECVDIDEILEGLWKEGILKGFERTERKKESFKEKLMFLQEYLPRRGDNAFPAFLRCLRKRNGELADKMEADWKKQRGIESVQKSSRGGNPNGASVSFQPDTTKTPTIESGRNAQDAPASSRDVTDDAAVIGSDAPPDSHPSQPQRLDITFQRAERLWGPPEAYKMLSNPRGHVLLINNVRFKKLNERRGAAVDAENMANLFRNLHFEVHREENLKIIDMKRTIRSFAQSPLHAHGDCCGVVVMSHGDQSDKSYVVYSVDHAPLQVEWIIGNFSNEDAPELQNKPKLFFFQACRGQEQFLKSESGMETDSFQVDCHSASFQSDIFVANSSIPDFVSYRNVDRGSWFIESICDVFAKNAHNLDLQSMMTLVHERLSKYEGERGEKQSAEYWVRGNFKKLYFNPGIVAANP